MIILTISFSSSSQSTFAVSQVLLGINFLGLMCKMSSAVCLHIFFLVGYAEERLWWPIQSPSRERKKEESKQLRGERDKIKFMTNLLTFVSKMASCWREE